MNDSKKWSIVKKKMMYDIKKSEEMVSPSKLTLQSIIEGSEKSNLFDEVVKRREKLVYNAKIGQYVEKLKRKAMHTKPEQKTQNPFASDLRWLKVKKRIFTKSDNIIVKMRPESTCLVSTS